MTNGGHSAHRVRDAMNVAAIFVAMVAAVFAGWSAWENHRAVEETSRGVHEAHVSALETAKATRAQVLLQVVTEYGGPEFFKSLQSLRTWQGDHPKNPEVAFKALVLERGKSRATSKRYKEIASSLRVISFFFEKVQLLTEQQLIDKESLQSLWNCSTYTDLVADLLVPMNVARVDGLVETCALSSRASTEARNEAASQLGFFRTLLCAKELASGALTGDSSSPLPAVTETPNCPPAQDLR